MRAVVEARLRRLWGGEGGAFLRFGAAVILAPLSWLWAGATALRNRRHDRAVPEAVPGLVVVSVGNLAVGGTGKTPLASWIARRYRSAGARPALLLSGYGRDEELLHARSTPDVPVFADRDRTEAARAARAAGARVAILDDGFQHRRLGRALDLVVLALVDPFPGSLLPRGPYRERPGALARADAVVLTRRSGTPRDAEALAERVHGWFPGLVRASIHLLGGRWTRLDGSATEGPRSDVLAVAAVGRPAAFADAVRGRTGGAEELVAFPDHHPFGAADVRRIRRRAGDRPVVVTEKDAVKLLPFEGLLGEVQVLAQDVGFDWGEETLGALLDAVAPAEVA